MYSYDGFVIYFSFFFQVPFEIEFTKDFLEGKLELNPLVQKQEVRSLMFY